ncbi:MAG: YkvA family protein [bacterium]
MKFTLCTWPTRTPGPWYAKAFAALVLGYALSPIDLIPDFIPVLGYLDDLVIVPAGIALLLKMILREVLEDCREKAPNAPREKLRNWTAGAIIILIWIVAIAITPKVVWRILAR